ncbi:hypothetical protein D3C71_1631200 [compost metagenome]
MQHLGEYRQEEQRSFWVEQIAQIALYEGAFQACLLRRQVTDVHLAAAARQQCLNADPNQVDRTGVFQHVEQPWRGGDHDR